MSPDDCAISDRGSGSDIGTVPDPDIITDGGDFCDGGRGIRFETVVMELV